MPVLLHSNRPNKKVGLRPPIRATRFRAKTQYILPSSQKQGMWLWRGGLGSRLRVRRWMPHFRKQIGALFCFGYQNAAADP
jgi:hypothetical protein